MWIVVTWIQIFGSLIIAKNESRAHSADSSKVYKKQSFQLHNDVIMIKEDWQIAKKSTWILHLWRNSYLTMPAEALPIEKNPFPLKNKKPSSYSVYI